MKSRTLPRTESSDDEWERTAARFAARWKHLDATDRTHLLEGARALDHTRYWESVDQLSVTPTMRALVACHAALLTVNLGLEFLADVTSIILAPTSVTRTTRHRDGPVISEGVACILGESMLHGPVRIAWDRVVQETVPGATTSVILHEFGHKIDMRDGVADGVPPLRSRAATRTFANSLDEVLRAVRVPGATTPLRTYGATNRIELFAVATEAFFLQPFDVKEHHAGLYDLLAGFYRQDPASSSIEG